MVLCSYRCKPANLGIRGLTVEELASADLWWNGPKLLKRSKQDWPECKFDKPTSTETLKEQKGTKGCYHLTEEGEEMARVEEV